LNNELILVLDFGGQYNQLIARRVREANVYCEVLPYNSSIDKINQRIRKGLFLREALHLYWILKLQSVTGKF